MKHFAVRTVKNGEVRIDGKTYVPHARPDKPYDGRFEGQRFAFGLYHWPDTPFVSLWGTERDFNDPEAADWGKWPVCENGTFHFEWWDEKQV